MLMRVSKGQVQKKSIKKCWAGSGGLYSQVGRPRFEYIVTTATTTTTIRTQSGQEGERDTASWVRRTKHAGSMGKALAAFKEKRAARQREEAAAQAAKIQRALRRAEENGKVEKTAGESGAAGRLRDKWKRWLASEHGSAVATRLATTRSPTVEDAKLFSTWVYTVRERFSPVGAEGCGKAPSAGCCRYRTCSARWCSR